MGEVEDILKDYEVKKEGEAEILMLASNAVFFNPVQVHNRDMSIAVLRTFVAKRKEEYEELMNKRNNKSNKKGNQVETPVVNGDTALTSQHDEIGVVHEKETNQPTNEIEDLSKEETKTPSRKVTRELKPPIVLEALAASGLRSLRYAREVDGLGKVVALDNDKASIEACKRNIKFNGASAISKVEAHLADARVYMLTHPKEFDVVDLDPYGSPSVFLDSAVQAVADGGLLMCTATDLAVLCGTNGEVCYSKYGSYPVKGKYCHEMALRILLACIESHANRYKRYIVPVLSVYMDFYVRVFVRVFTSASEIKNTPLKLSYVYQCAGCDSFHLQSLGRTVTKNNSLKHAPGIGPVVPQECSDCGKKFNVGGPIWSAPIHDQDWVLSTLTDVRQMKDRYPAYNKITSVLTTVSEVLPWLVSLFCQVLLLMHM
uniref:tRNA (guanine(26)-N(2))-dimethyltransferase n=1 Tax=Aegilops tauschii subsp. strangulata TaxID=200361 RepID=A0A453IE40_AEGTS